MLFEHNIISNFLFHIQTDFIEKNRERFTENLEIIIQDVFKCFVSGHEFESHEKPNRFKSTCLTFKRELRRLLDELKKTVIC